MRDGGLGSWPERRLQMSPEREALWFEGRSVSYAALAHQVRRTAGALAGLGVATGDRVAWIGGNHPAALETLYACGQLGAVWVPINTRLTPSEARFVLAHSGTSVVVLGRDHGHLAAALRDQLPEVRTWVVVEQPVPPPDCLSYEDIGADADAERRDLPISLDDPCLIMYTSGTTGTPKGAVLTHGNMIWACVNQVLGFDLAADERTMAMAPLFHIGGLNGTVNPTLLRGGCVVVVRGFDPGVALETIETRRVSSFFAVPTMLDAMSRHPDFTTRDLSSLRTVCAAGAPLPLSTLRTWLDRGVTMQQAYGMTESAPAGTVLDSADAERKIGSAGRAQFFTDVRVVRADGSPAAQGEIGEVVLSGPNIMAGYWNEPDRTAEVLTDGWLRTGDAGSMDEDGFLHIRDRYKDMFISGGENVYPAEVESALLDLPGIAEAAVIGVPDQTWGEVGLALLVVGDAAVDPDALRTTLRTRLAAFKVPRHIEFVDALPKTATGKIHKPTLRDHHRSEHLVKGT